MQIKKKVSCNNHPLSNERQSELGILSEALVCFTQLLITIFLSLYNGSFIQIVKEYIQGEKNLGSLTIFTAPFLHSSQCNTQTHQLFGGNSVNFSTFFRLFWSSAYVSVTRSLLKGKQYFQDGKAEFIFSAISLFVMNNCLQKYNKTKHNQLPSNTPFVSKPTKPDTPI